MRGRPISQSEKKKLPHVQARIEAPLYAKLRSYAEANEMNISEAVRACINAYLSPKRDLRERGYLDGLLRAASATRKVKSSLDGLFPP